MQHTHILNKIKKSTLVVLATLGILALSSCTKPIPEGPVKDFIMAFDYDKAFENVEYATSTISSVSFVKGKEDGKVTTVTQIHKKGNEYYQYLNTELDGSYHGTDPKQFDYYTQEILTYGNINDGVRYAIEKTDGALKKLEYSNTDLKQSVVNFFYKQLKSNFHHGGMYYADYIIRNAGEFHDQFSVDGEKNELMFKYDSVSNYDGQLVINRQEYRVNKYGMVIYVKTRSELYEDITTYTETIAQCSYEKFNEKDKLMEE